MKKIRIIELLSAFSESEVNEFSRFIQNGFIRGSRDYGSLMNAVLSYYPEFDQKSISLKEIYRLAYPEGKYNNRVIISRLSELNKIAEEYLVLKRCRVNKYLRNIALNEELQKRKLFPYSESLLNKAISSLKSNLFYSSKNLLELNEYLTMKQSQLSQENRYPEVLDILNENAHAFYSFGIMHVLDLFITIQNTRSFHNPNLDIQSHKRVIEGINFSKVIDGLKKANPKQARLAEVYYMVYRLNNSGHKKKTYQALKKKFYKIVFFLPRETRSSIFSHMYHFCLAVINRGRNTMLQEYNLELYDLLKKIIETDSYSSSDDEYLSVYLFREFILTGLRGKKYIEVESFIKSFGEKLNPDLKDCMIHFGYARLLFEKNKFGESLAHLKQINIKTYIIRFDVIYHTMACYYELDMIEEAIMMADNTRHFLNSIKGYSDVVKLGLKDFLKIYRKLIKQKLNPKKETLQSLKLLVAKSKFIYLPSWINEKINDLLKMC
jgi:hypothetical protein